MPVSIIDIGPFVHDPNLAFVVSSAGIRANGAAEEELFKIVGMRTGA
jgi:hypothetical protein